MGICGGGKMKKSGSSGVCVCVCGSEVKSATGMCLMKEEGNER